MAEEQLLSDRQRGLLTLICDKINMHGYMIGAHRNRNWCTQQYYKSIPESEQMQGTLDRIGKIEYSRCFHIDESKPIEPTLENIFSSHERKGPEFYDHSIHCVWREPFGEGYGKEPSECLLSSMTQDKAGNWHMPCDLAFWVTLWHPSSQNGNECGEGQEAIGGCWLKRPAPRWRPTYHYTDLEVIEALKIMCAEFDWEFEHTGDSGYMIMY
jgi:hypothetical protein